ncbi:protein crumbs-like isoform X1 [Haliotis rufescens]|uniref:protein crumbs-like isoform X1 n=1 Tax=Haliotis rufescens TaxID=6454 RepID=UPI00201F8190|nr:protein crumbs-like isoform X1 [Haliotis rufescens]
MAQFACHLVRGALCLVFLFRLADSQTEYGYFNGSSSVILPNSVWDLRQWTQLSFRTCNSSGEIIRQTNSRGDMLQMLLRNGSLEFHWRVNNATGSSRVGSRLNSNKWYIFNLRYHLGSIVLNVSNEETSFSQIVANSTHFSYLLDVRLNGSNIEVGTSFSGCLFSGIGISFLGGGIVSSNVRWNYCPLTNQTGCTPGDGDIDNCWNNPCHQGRCVDGYKNFTCVCPHNYNGTYCENDLSHLGCHVVNLCLNNATCVANPDEGTTYRCMCTPGYTGTNCETEIDECRRDPCKNGQCIDLVNGFRCNCTGSGYDGDTCIDDVSECDLTPGVCGSGTCVNNPGSFTCVCPPGYDGIGCVLDVNECDSIPCQNGGNCTNGMNTYLCTCPRGFTGHDCEGDIDDCVNVTCRGANTRCLDGINGYTCVCNDGYSGFAPVCRDIDECASNPCYGNATCDNLENAFRCHCSPGYTGDQCQTNINECQDNPCQNGGTCKDEVNSYRCECVDGYKGDNCSENIQECQEMPMLCKNGATCLDGINEYVCACAPGWTGIHCETDFNECDSNPCLNGATCHNHTNYYNCSCALGFTGFDCSENIDECTPNPCLHGGRCQDGISSFTCNCSSEWMGRRCNDTYNACTALSPCQNGGTCNTQQPNQDYNCTCVAGFNGRNCEINVNDCRSDSCKPFEQCYDAVGNFTCGCPVGYTGSDCSTEINDCDPNPCVHGTCHDHVGEYTCTCQRQLVNLTNYTPGQVHEFYTGWQGVNCDEDINECNQSVVACLNRGLCQNSPGSYECYCGGAGGDNYGIGTNCERTSSYCQLEAGGAPCKNGGTCINLQRNFECLCAPGYSGDRCQSNIDECDPNPCLYNGTCEDGINSYNCTCIPGITGDNCEININECWPRNPCLNYGTCNDQINGYECDCTNTGFNGTNCESNINDCIGVPCQNGGTCVDGVKSYDCACYAGYTGSNCEEDINECLSIPCQYNGTCIERSKQALYGHHTALDNFSYATAAGYICECITGITGQDCEVNIDDCVNHPCEYGATCEDLINAFRCNCAPGYEGQLCNTEVNECTRYRACQNGATCTDRINAYDCQCPAFQQGQTTYGGQNCTIVLTGCDANTMCQNGATCVPTLNEANQHGYNCRCTTGFTGRHCDVSTTISFANGAQITKAFVTNFTLHMRFRTTLKSAVLMVYKPGRDDYISMEIHDEKLVAVFGSSVKPLSSHAALTRRIVNDAVMHTVTMIVKQNITMKLESSLCNSLEACTASFSFPRPLGTDVNELFIGNVDQSVMNSTLSKTAFTGCMEDIKYNGNYVIPSNDFIASFHGVQNGCQRSEQCLPYTCNRNGDCEDLWNTFRCDCHRPYLGNTCQTEYTPVTFSKDNVQSWASFSLSSLSPRLNNTINLSLFVRTRQTDGIIMYLGNTNPSSYITLEMTSGMLSATFMLCNAEHILNSTTPYNDGEAHFVEIKKTSTDLSLSVNQGFPDLTPFTDTEQSTATCLFQPDVTYFGGRVPTAGGVGRRRRAVDGSSPYFQGVIQDVEVNGVKLEFFPVNGTTEASLVMSSSSNLTEGKVSTEKACDLLPCKQNGNCSNEFYNDFRCECPYGYRGKDCGELDFCRNSTCPDGATCNSLNSGYECISSSTFNGATSLASYTAILESDREIHSVSLKLRTGVLYGALLHIQHGQHFMKLRVAGGNVQLNYKLKDEISSVLNVHQVVNDGQQYDIKMTMKDNDINLQVLLNSTILKEADVNVDNTLTNLTNLIQNGAKIYIGGTGPGQSWEQPYKGCLEEVRIGGILLPFYYDNTFFNNDMRTEKFIAASIVNLLDGCRKDPSPSISGKNGATCEIGWNGKPTCACRTGFTGQWCEINIDDCTASSCQNGGVCVDGVNSFSCKCRRGYSGDRCQQNVDYCNGTVCSNNGSCQEETAGFMCNCSEEFTGITCNTRVNQSCRTELCQNGGTCSNINITQTSGTVASFNCTCAAGYEGPLCERPQDFCSVQTCGSRGNCTSDPDTRSYTCSCDAGWTGTNCETNINECHMLACENGGTCQDADSGFVCNCTDGWTGNQCTVRVKVCNNNPCQRGNCSDVQGTAQCNCTGSGFEGDGCTVEVNECDDNPCQNDGTCSNTEGSYICNCTIGYTGPNCSIVDCGQVDCRNGGTCGTNADNTKWKCHCTEYYAGDMCDIRGPCFNQTCELANTDQCVQNIEAFNYTCVCNNGWEGDNCTQDINECDTGVQQCQNGHCNNSDGSYSCDCYPGYIGQLCDIDIDYCQPGFCQPGVCTERNTSFSCNCTNTGYEGEDCTTDIDECEVNNSCRNDNMICNNTDGGFTCPCKAGFLGQDCVMDPCTETTCDNEGTCNSSSVDNISFEPVCYCASGYEGARCEKALPVTGPEELNIWYIIGPIIAIVLLVVLIGVIIFLMMARTKRATRGTYSPSRQETSGARVELGNVLKKPPEERLI